MNKKNYSLSFIISAIIYTSLIFGYFFFINKNHTIKKKLQTQKIKIALISPPKIVQKPKEMPKKIVSTPLVTPQPIIKKPIKKKIEKPKKKKIIKKIKPKKKKKVKKRIKKKKHTKIKKKKVVKKVVHKKVKKTKHTKKVIKKRKKPIRKKKEVIVYSEPQPTIKVPKQTTKKRVQQIYEEEYIQPTTPIITTPVKSTPKISKTPVVTPKKVIKSNHRISTRRNNHNENIKREFLIKVRETIYANKQYPLRAKRNHIQGRVHVVFDILPNGKAVNIRMDNAPRVLKKAVYRSLRKSFPIDIPPSIASEFPMRGISVNVNFILH